MPALVLLGTVVFATTSLGGGGCSWGCPEFNWSEWRAPRSADERGEDGETVRQVMADEIEGCGTLDGHSRPWVEERLGRGSPARRPAPGSFKTELMRDLRQHPSVSYTLGLCTAERNCMFTGDTEYLEIRYQSYAPNAKVRSVDVFGT